MIRILVLLLAVVTGVASYYLMKKSAAFLPLLKKETATESQQFIERFGRYYLIIAILGVLAAIFNRPLLSIGFIFFVLLLSNIIKDDEFKTSFKKIFLNEVFFTKKCQYSEKKKRFQFLFFFVCFTIIIETINDFFYAERSGYYVTTISKNYDSNRWF